MLEESFEFAEAVESGDRQAIREELGDVLLQVGDYKLIDVMSYMQALGKFKKGDKTTLVIKRDTKEVSFDIQF